MFVQAVLVLVVILIGWAYQAIQPPPPKFCGSPDGPPVTSPRIRIRDGRYLSYKERGVPKDTATYKIIVAHGFADSKDCVIPVSPELVEELGIYLLSFDRAGYGESDPNPKRSVKSEAFDIQDLADQLEIGSKFYVIGISMGAYSAWSCLKHIPHRLAGIGLIVPMVNYWWPSFPANLSGDGFRTLPEQDQWTLRIAHYAPSLLHWWMTQKWFPSLSLLKGHQGSYSHQDREILQNMLAAKTHNKVLPSLPSSRTSLLRLVALLNLIRNYYLYCCGLGDWCDAAVEVASVVGAIIVTDVGVSTVAMVEVAMDLSVAAAGGEDTPTMVPRRTAQKIGTGELPRR
ncbi:uncharacterized protein LOC131247334 [Magnolia sinica]|uniref:uncharacterized protein LOC131247334 n=1 Tax=Magnolia sinica TaxID=86752 RepID=UPI002659FB07|nr:uncharacterized protein LOC131247334 [Magnolia sinica]